MLMRPSIEFARSGRPMLITLFTDASYCSQTRIGAYAVWAKTDGRTLRRAGLLKQPAASSALAETMALVNGIHLAITGMRPPPASRIIAQTDCLTAIEALAGRFRKPRTIAKYAAVVDAYRRRVEADRYRGGIPPCRRSPGHHYPAQRGEHLVRRGMPPADARGPAGGAVALPGRRPGRRGLTDARSPFLIPRRAS